MNLNDDRVLVLETRLTTGRIVGLSIADIGRQTDRQTNKQASRQTDKQTDRQTDRQIDKQTERQIDRQVDKQTNKQTDRQKTEPIGRYLYRQQRHRQTLMLADVPDYSHESVENSDRRGRQKRKQSD